MVGIGVPCILSASAASQENIEHIEQFVLCGEGETFEISFEQALVPWYDWRLKTYDTDYIEFIGERYEALYINGELVIGVTKKVFEFMALKGGSTEIEFAYYELDAENNPINEIESRVIGVEIFETYIRVVTDKDVYSPSENVTIELVLVNRRDVEVTYEFYSTHQWDVAILAPYEGWIYHSWEHMVFLPVLTNITVPGNSEMVIGGFTWEQVNDQGEKVSPGTYLVACGLFGEHDFEPLEGGKVIDIAPKNP
jgi:hypothetical protein